MPEARGQITALWDCGGVLTDTRAAERATLAVRRPSCRSLDAYFVYR
jgi:hypothetical protein